MKRILQSTYRSIFLLGDIVVFLLALALALVVRGSHSFSFEYFSELAYVFIPIWIVNLLVFYVVGLYERVFTTSLRVHVMRLINAEGIIVVFAVLMFYFVPFLGITPKLILLLYFVFSILLSVLWRHIFYRFLTQSTLDNVVIVGRKKDMDLPEVFSARTVDTAMPDFLERALSLIKTGSIVVIDYGDLLLQVRLDELFKKLPPDVHMVDFIDFYGQICGRLPLSHLSAEWLLRNTAVSRPVYDFSKRAFDILAASLLLIILSPIMLLTALAVRIFTGSPIIFKHPRVGKGGKIITLYKFRSMHDGQYVTKVGKITRALRVDEFAQFWNVIRGDLSLIGPRPESPELVEEYAKAIPYYSLRHRIAPGASGWAQVYHKHHPHHAAAIEETKDKLSYDLYYIQHRSFMLDLAIGLRTIKTILGREGK